jgi:hypothetical protein
MTRAAVAAWRRRAARRAQRERQLRQAAAALPPMPLAALSGAS